MSTAPAINVEVCIDCSSVAAVQCSVAAAHRGGAARIELCSDMAQAGLTPPAAHIRAAREAFGQRPGVLAMIRPRGGDFCFSADEITVMHDQIAAAATAGADGVVIGVLDGDRIAATTVAALVSTASHYDLYVTFHRAFDAVADPPAALEQLIDLGVARVLTSGTGWATGRPARAGIDRLRALVEQAGPRIEIVIGGGIQPNNVRQLLDQLPIEAGRVSVHAHSGVYREGLADAELVAQLVQAAARARVRR